jgi:hypothetical protein
MCASELANRRPESIPGARPASMGAALDKSDLTDLLVVCPIFPSSFSRIGHSQNRS